MPWQTIDVPFGQGVDTQTDEKLVLPGKLVTLENGRFDKRGRVSKRPGIATVGGVWTGLGTGKIAADDHWLYRRDSTALASIFGKGKSKTDVGRNYVFPRLTGGVIGGAVSTAASAEYQISTVDLVLDTVGAKYGLGAYSDSNGRVWLTAIDYTSMRPIVTEQVLLGMAARVLPNPAGGSFIVAAYGTAGTLNIYSAVAPSGSAPGVASAFTGLSAPVMTVAGLNAESKWDWFLLGSVLYVVYLDAAGTTMTVARHVLGGATTTASWAVAGVETVTVSANTTAGIVGIFWTTGGATATVNFRSYDRTSLVLVSAAGAIHTEAAGSGTGAKLTAYVDTASLWFAMQCNSTATTAVRVVVASSSNLVGAAITASKIDGVYLASKMTSDKYVGCCFEYDAIQSMLLFYNFDTRAISGKPLLAGRIFSGRTTSISEQAGGYVSRSLPVAFEFSRDGFGSDLVVAALVAPDASVADSFYTGTVYRLGYAEAWKPGQRPCPQAKLNGRAVFGGGYLHQIGAQGVTPNGFLAHPTQPTLTPAIVGGNIEAGTYQVRFTLEWIDEAGDLHESAPSVAVSATVASGVTGSIAFVVIANPIDTVRAAAGNVWLVAWRTTAAGATFYREQRFRVLDPTANSVRITGTLTQVGTTLDNAARLNQDVDGGRIENAQPDCPLALCSDVDRLWVVPGSAPNTVLPSKPKDVGYGVDFFPDVYRVISAHGDSAVALARQDGAIVAFKSSDCFVARGEGPDATGNNDNLGEFTTLFPNIGAEAHSAVIPGNLGLYVKDARDVWFIGRDFSRERIGADVESFTSLPFRAAANVEALRQVRMLVGAENTTCTEIVFDEDERQWSVNPRPLNDSNSRPCVAEFNGVVLYVVGGGEIIAEEIATKFQDIGTSYALKLVTAWIKPAMVLQGFAKVRRALLLGENLEAHTLQYRIRYDYETTWSAAKTITSANATIGSSAYQPEIRFGRQKCQAFQLEITEVLANSQGFSLAGLTLEVLALGGAKRLRAEKRV